MSEKPAEYAWRESLDPDVQLRLGAMWGKSDAGGRMNLLLQHLFDAMAVAELIWDQHLASGIRSRINDATRGRGRDFLRWLCGLHDVGKATPAFQSQSAPHVEAIKAARLSWPRMSPKVAQSWRHDVAGARVLLENLNRAWPREIEHQDWIWPLIAGHHGSFPGFLSLKLHEPLPAHGDLGWCAVQNHLVEIVTSVSGFDDLLDAQPARQLTKSDQLLISGLMVMVDWIASDAGPRRFVGIDRLEDVGLASARRRAASAWESIALKPGWVNLTLPVAGHFKRRFDRDPRPFQDLVVEEAHSVPAAGLMVLEAPMGEGKTEAALAAAEILAARFGANGLFVGMPTQATSDPMFSRVLEWSRAIDPSVPVALLHGKKMFNKEWKDLLASRLTTRLPDKPGEDEYGLPDEYGMGFSNINEDGGAEEASNAAPAEWYLGRKRGLLAPIVIGTIDQLLYAATRTKHVMLRYAGLAGKVVVLDEIHAADVYMSQFLCEALRWLGQGKVPVVLLSATLSPPQRRQLVSSYLAGASGKVRFVADDLAAPDGYPNVTSAWVSDGIPKYSVRATRPWRNSLPVQLEVLREGPSDNAASLVAEAVQREVTDGGCVLVIRNTVRRAQETFSTLRESLGEDVQLLHARLSAADRADSTQHVLNLLGPPGTRFNRPKRLVVVATQVAEQSFDVDVDLLISDLAPVDLLLQRAGRLHRHERSPQDRPEGLRAPRMVVTGMSIAESRPWFVPGSERIYGRFHLLRTAALVKSAVADSGWSIPADVPQLVGKVYQDRSIVPAAWISDEKAARETWEAAERERQNKALPFLLTGQGHYSDLTLEGLHRLGGSEPDEDVGRVVVRDGEPSVEVLLLRRDDQGYRSLSGRRLGINGEALNSRSESQDLLTEVLGGSVRMPAGRESNEVLDLRTLPEWIDHPWLRYSRVLCLDGAGRAELPSFTVRYDRLLGLQVNRKAS